ncbi:MAG: hypothetical protein QM767_11515 [Anaeromyxobacter sp.]
MAFIWPATRLAASSEKTSHGTFRSFDVLLGGPFRRRLDHGDGGLDLPKRCSAIQRLISASP